MDVACTLVMLRVEGDGLVLLPLTKPAQPLNTNGTSANTVKSTQPCQEFWSSRNLLLCVCVCVLACRPFTKFPRCCLSEINLHARSDAKHKRADRLSLRPI